MNAPWALRFWGKVNKCGGVPKDRPQLGQCWLWLGAKSRGYGYFWFAGKNVRAHRFLYEFLIGQIPSAKELDHVCRNSLCVNPKHLEVVTHKENTLRGNGIAARQFRKTTCLRGHPFVRSGDKRFCRTCKREANRRWRASNA